MKKKIFENKRSKEKKDNDSLFPSEGPGIKDMQELYSWDFDKAWEAQEEWEKRHGTPFDNHIDGLLQGKILPRSERGPFFRWMGAQELKDLYEVYRMGESSAITEALYICTINSLPIPEWCEIAYLKAYRKVRQYKAKSWDDVFGRPHKKGTHLATKRQEREKSISVYNRIKEIKRNEPDTPIDENLFERVGRYYGIGGKTLTAQYYYAWKNKLETPSNK